MPRLIEWSLAVLAASLCVVGVGLIVANLAPVMNAPFDSWWPLPGLLLLEVLLLGAAGLAGVFANGRAGAGRWQSAAWVASGGLAALGAIGWYGVSVFVLALVPAVLFGLAALLADWRRRGQAGRGLLEGLGTLVLSAGLNIAAVALLIGWARV